MTLVLGSRRRLLRRHDPDLLSDIGELAGQILILCSGLNHLFLNPLIGQLIPLIPLLHILIQLMHLRLQVVDFLPFTTIGQILHRLKLAVLHSFILIQLFPLFRN